MSNFLEWSIYCLVSFPDVQAKAALEILENIGSKVVSLEDEAKLPYMHAVIQV